MQVIRHLDVPSIVVAPVPSRPVVRPRHVVQRQFRSLLEERGWQRRGNSYFGYYRTPYGAYAGRIVLRDNTPPSYYIFNPPDCLWDHSHATCFRQRGDGTYEVHFTKHSQALDDGFLAIEGILREAHEGE